MRKARKTSNTGPQPIASSDEPAVTSAEQSKEWDLTVTDHERVDFWVERFTTLSGPLSRWRFTGMPTMQPWVLTSPYEFARVKAALERAGLKAELGEVTMKPATEAELAGDDAVRMQKLLDTLESLDDVQDVYTSAVIP